MLADFPLDAAVDLVCCRLGMAPCASEESDGDSLESVVQDEPEGFDEDDLSASEGSVEPEGFDWSILTESASAAPSCSKEVG